MATAKARKAKSPRTWRTPPRRRTKRWSRWWPKGNDELLEEFFAEGTLPVEHIIDGLAQAIRDDRLYPVLCASALHNVGSGSDSEFHQRVFPGPGGSRTGGRAGRTATKRTAQIKDTEPVSAFVFKTVADAFAGRVSYFKVMSGSVKNDANLVNGRTRNRGAAGAYRRAGGQDAFSRSPNCRPAISARWRN